MSNQSLMIRVTGEDIQANHPAPYTIFTAEGVMLLPKGKSVSRSEQVAILRAQGWRMLMPDEAKPEKVFSQEEAIQSIQLSDLRLPIRQHPPINLVDAMIADDMKLIRQLLSRMLQESGIKKIDTVNDGRMAISHFLRYQPHIVFLDIDMPGIDGIAVLKQIKQWSPDTFVSMVSGNSTMVNVKEAKSYGVDAFLVKPLNALNLKRVLTLYEATIEI